MKKTIRLTESDLIRLVKKTINEMEDEDFMRGADRNWEDKKEDDDDYKDRSMYSPYYGDDEEWGQTDRGDEHLQDLIEEARDILENELGFSIDAINEMDEFEIVDALHDHGYDELAYDIEHLMEKEGFYNVDEDEPYGAIGGHSVNDLKKAFAKTKGRDEELGEGWDDFTQKKRYPEDFKPEKYMRIPKSYFKTPRSLDPEGTIGMPKKKEDFDDYEEVELDETWDDFTQKKRYPEGYKDEKYERLPKGFLRKHSGSMADPEGTVLTYADFTDDDPDNIDIMRGHLGLDDEDDDELV